jgi:serine/threonine protein kinase
MWTYKNEEVKGISDFPSQTYGFVYRIVHIPTGKTYIGKKILQNTTKVKLTKKELAEYTNVIGRKPAYKLAVKESNWQTYWGSNKHLKELLETEPKENFKREILVCAPTKKLLTYQETKHLFIYQVLEKSDEFFNDNILGKFFTKDFDIQD